MQSFVNVLIRYPDDPPATRMHEQIAAAIIGALFIG
jgi:hypothetical protein